MGAEESGLAFLPEAVALSPDVQHVAVVQQPVQHRRGDDGVAEKLSPLPEAFIRRQDDAAPLVPSGDQGEERSGGVPVIGPDAELVHDEDLGSQVDPQSAVQVVLGPGLPEVFHQVVGADEVGPVPVLDGFLGQCHRQVSLAYSRRS